MPQRTPRVELHCPWWVRKRFCVRNLKKIRFEVLFGKIQFNPRAFYPQYKTTYRCIIPPPRTQNRLLTHHGQCSSHHGVRSPIDAPHLPHNYMLCWRAAGLLPACCWLAAGLLAVPWVPWVPRVPRFPRFPKVPRVPRIPRDPRDPQGFLRILALAACPYWK